MKIKLRKDWEISIQPPLLKTRESGYFTGRGREVKKLTSEIINKDQGSILVSGYRGVGKTSTVYKALSEAGKAKKNLIVVILNAAQLDANRSNEKTIAPDKIIQNLIRRLYSTAKDYRIIEPLKRKIEVLYKKAVASEFKLKENYRHQTEIISQIEKEEKSESLINENSIKTLIFVVAWTLAVFLQVYHLFPDTYEWLNKLLPLILALPAPISINLFIKWRKKVSVRKELKENAELLYEFDNSIGNLEFDLEEIHKELYKKGMKLVYIIDELDKLESEEVINVLKFFKNLFTLSKALFIFIGDEEIFFRTTKKNEAHVEIYRPKEYTYFTSKYFIARPLWRDLSEYIDNIVDKKEIDDINYTKLKHALVFDAKNDFFDLNTVIKDRVTNFDDKWSSLINVDEIGQEDILKYRFHRALTTVFENKYLYGEPSMWHENEKVLRHLFSHADSLILQHSGHECKDDDKDTSIASATRDFNALLQRLGAFDIASEAKQNIRGLQVPINTYRYTGSIPVDSPIKLDQPSEIEKRFMNEFKKFCLYIVSLNNILRDSQNEQALTLESFFEKPTEYAQKINSWGFDASSQFNKLYPTYKDFSSKPPVFSYKREDIEQKTTQVLNHTKSMLANIYAIMANIICSLYTELDLKTSQLAQNGNLFGGSADSIRTAMQNSANHVVFKTDYSRQILIVPNQLDNLIPLKDIIKDNAETHTVINIADEPKSLRTKGIFQINYGEPRKLLYSSKKVMGYLRQFFSSNKEVSA